MISTYGTIQKSNESSQRNNNPTNGRNMRNVDNRPLWQTNPTAKKRVEFTNDNEVKEDKSRKKERVWMYSALVLATPAAKIHATNTPRCRKWLAGHGTMFWNQRRQ